MKVSVSGESKDSMTNRLWAAALATAFVATAVAAPHAEILEQIIVKVNGDIITKTEFEQRQVMALRARKMDVTPESEELKKAVAEITPQLIVDAVDELIMLQRGKDLGYKLSDEQFNQVVSQIRKDNHLETEEAFLAALKQEGMTMADLRRSLEKQMIISRVQGQEVMQKVGITEEEALAYHAAHREEFTKPASVTLREIQLNVPSTTEGVTAAADQATRDRLEEIRARIKGGEAFEKIAGELSEAPSRANGGLIGPLTMSELAPALQKMLSGMKPGDITDPLRTPKGYQLLKLESITPEEVQPPEQVREQIAEKLFQAKRAGELRKYLAKMRKEAIIEWKNDELRKAYEAGLAADATETTAPDAAPAAPSAAPAAPPTAPSGK
jgi:peptidyl-prolyl cis-trans isomerase SurA